MVDGGGGDGSEDSSNTEKAEVVEEVHGIRARHGICDGSLL